MLLAHQSLPNTFRNMCSACSGVQPSRGTCAAHVPRMAGRYGAQTFCACKTAHAHGSQMEMLLCARRLRQAAETNAAARSPKIKKRIAACNICTSKPDTHMIRT